MASEEKVGFLSGSSIYLPPQQNRICVSQEYLEAGSDSFLGVTCAHI